jgi:hypothetical protein
MPAAADCMPAPPAAPPEGAGDVVFDNHGNYWTLAPAGKKGRSRLFVLPAQGQQAWVADTLSGLKPGNWRRLVADEFGYVWVSDSHRVLRLDPHAPEAGWQEISADSAFCDDAITAMAVGPSGAVMVAFKRGGIATLDRIRPQRKRRDTNVIRRTDAPADIGELRTDSHGDVWAKARGKVYKLEAPADAWQRAWELVARMPSGSHDLSGDVLEGKFYMDWAITGDFGYPSTGRFHSKLLEFDPSSMRWRIVADYGLPRGYCAVGALDGQVWTVAGAALDPDGNRHNPVLTQVFDPATGAITKGPDLPVALPAAIALGVGERLYVLGFPAGKDVPLRLFSIGKGEKSWTAEADGPSGGGSSYGTALDGKLYTVVPHKCIAIFDTKTKAWETTEAPHSPRSPAISHYRGEVWVMGGRTREGGEVSYIYNPDKNQWRKGPELPRELIWGCAFNIEGALYLSGGAGGRCYNGRTFRLRSPRGSPPTHPGP